jgi:hypothetical protein
MLLRYMDEVYALSWRVIFYGSKETVYAISNIRFNRSVVKRRLQALKTPKERYT